MTVLFYQFDGAGVPSTHYTVELNLQKYVLAQRINFCLLSSNGCLQIIYAINHTIISKEDPLAKW